MHHKKEKKQQTCIDRNRRISHILGELYFTTKKKHTHAHKQKYSSDSHPNSLFPNRGCVQKYRMYTPFSFSKIDSAPFTVFHHYFVVRLWQIFICDQNFIYSSLISLFWWVVGVFFWGGWSLFLQFNLWVEPAAQYTHTHTHTGIYIMYLFI